MFVIASAQLGAIDVKRANADDDRHGTDFWAVVPKRSAISIDVEEEVRDWPDIDLEMYSVVETGEPGWAIDPNKRTDFLLFLWPKRSLLLSYPQVQAATIAHRVEWERLSAPRQEDGGRRPDTSTSGRYHTRNIHVPEIVLLDAIAGTSDHRADCAEGHCGGPCRNTARPVDLPRRAASRTARRATRAARTAPLLYDPRLSASRPGL